MQVRIVEKRFGGVEFAPEMKVLHLGGQGSANVERLEFTLPESWQGKSVTLHIQRQDGSLPAPILLDEAHSCAVGKEFTASPYGSWMLMALGEDGFRALTRPAKYDCYETLATDGDAEISQTQYEAFVAQVLAYSNNAQTSAQEARNSAAAAKADADAAETANVSAAAAADRAETAKAGAESGATRAEAAAKRAENAAPPEDGAVTAVNGKGGNVVLTAEDVGAMPEDSAGYVKSIALTGQILTLTMGDGSTRTLQTKDTTTLTDMTGVLGVKHGGTGKSTAMTAADVGAYRKSETYSREEADNKFGAAYTLPTATAYRLGGVKVGSGLSVSSDGKLSVTGSAYTMPTATASRLGGVKVGDYLDIAADGTLSAKTLNDKIAAAVAAKSEARLVWNHHTQSPTKWKTYDVSIPDGVDYLRIKTKCQTYSSEEITLARGGTTSHLFNNNSGSSNTYCTMTFQADGTLHVQGPYGSNMSYSYAIELWLSGYHYPTLEDLIKEDGV